MAGEAWGDNHDTEKRGERKLPAEVLKISGTNEKREGGDETEETEG